MSNGQYINKKIEDIVDYSDVSEETLRLILDENIQEVFNTKKGVVKYSKEEEESNGIVG